MLGLLEWVLVFAPLVFHGTVGLWLVVTRTQLGERSPYPTAVRIAMRATGVAAIAFLALHLPALRFHARGVRLGGDELATVLVSNLSSTWHGVPWQGAAYLVGTACVTFHLAAGMWAFCVTAASGANPRVRRLGAWGAAAVGAAIWMLLANIVVFRATGARLFGAAQQADEAGAGLRCPPDGTSHAP
jgi:succinate dehydrogenase/fumarate reductase cytochrome b subunit